MGSGDPHGLQNRRTASFGVVGGFDSHSLPPFFNHLQATKSVGNQLGLTRAICTTLAWVSCISLVTTSPYTFMVVLMSA